MIFILALTAVIAAGAVDPFLVFKLSLLAL